MLAHMIFRELRHKYGEGSAFLDVDSRSPGLSFPAKVATALSNSDAVLVIIGPTWITELDARKNDSRDWVRYEVAESLKRAHFCLSCPSVAQEWNLRGLSSFRLSSKIWPRATGLRWIRSRTSMRTSHVSSTTLNA